MEGDLAYIGAGLAGMGTGIAALGVGNVAANFLAGALRNPSAAASQTATLFIGIAFAEALGIFSFLVALLLMFAVYDRRKLYPYGRAGQASVLPGVTASSIGGRHGI